VISTIDRIQRVLRPRAVAESPWRLDLHRHRHGSFLTFSFPNFVVLSPYPQGHVLTQILLSMTAAYADLHTHSHCSDGVLSPSELVERAEGAGIRVLALTDHDTISGLEEAIQAAERTSVEIVTGVELSVSVEGEGVHLLGYGFDPTASQVVDYLRAFSGRRRQRMEAMVSRLQELGLGVEMGDVLAEANQCTALGRPHLARALVAGGHVGDVQAAFDRYIGNDQPAYVPVPGRPVEQAIQAIHDAGGWTSVAHPGQWMPGRILRSLRKAGVDGIEVTCPSHPPYLESYYRSICRSHDLVETGGSDFHRPPTDWEDRLGRLGLDRMAWNALSWPTC